MAGLLRDIGSALKGGGAKIIGKQIQRTPSTGTLEAFSGSTDCLGASAGTWHEFGSIETFDIPRAADGTHTLTPTLVEWDSARRNLLINAAPYNALDTAKPEELDLEDGTVIESSSAGEDTTLPYLEIIYRGAPDKTGKEIAFFCVAQLQRAGGPGTTKANSYTKPKVSFISIDASSAATEGGADYTCTKPAASGADSWVDGITAPTLAGANAMGVWVEAS
jgi:hypothetical protein